jgi:N-acetyl-anhydromuramyl-L-alanine amidase AmpD
MIPQDVPQADAYGGLFNLAEAVVLTMNDNDAGHVFGGKARPGTPGTPIRDLQTDLDKIGYSLHVNGKYDKYTHYAVAAFQRHFFSGDRRQESTGNVDEQTAQLIKNVLGP